MEPNAKSDLALPISVVGRIDVGRLLREVEAVDGFLRQSEIRQPGTPVKLPKTSRLFDETIDINNINVLREDERNKLRDFLTGVHEHSPVMHMSFSADPSPVFTQKLVIWLRENIHPQVLLQVGLRPNIGAGCTVRTTNHHFDFSLRSRISKSQDKLLQLLREMPVEDSGVAA